MTSKLPGANLKKSYLLLSMFADLDFDGVSEPLCEPNINCFLYQGLHLNLGRRFARSGGSLSPPVACATDRSKAVIWVCFLLHKNAGNSALCSLLLLWFV